VTGESDDEYKVRQLKALGQAFREARKQEGLTQKDLADRSGVSTTTIKRIETGAVNPAYEAMFQLAKGIGVPLTPILDCAQQLAEYDA
jgi:transcriptional regulator with XRE-family HTH domain